MQPVVNYATSSAAFILATITCGLWYIDKDTVVTSCILATIPYRLGPAT